MFFGRALTSLKVIIVWSSWCFLGGIIRDDHGLVLGAFSRRLPGAFSPYVAESVWPYERAGLLFAKNNRLTVSKVESDSIVSGWGLSIRSIINDIRILMEKVGGGSCSHIPRHSNMAAHTLAMLAGSGLIIEIVFGWMLVPLFFMIL